MPIIFKTQKMENQKIAVAMSGGIDSSVTALLLLEQGRELSGVTLRLWDYLSEGCEEKETGCCSMDAIMEARAFCQKIGIPHHIVDIRQDFKASVVQNFIDEYLDGRTPNPCVFCNPAIKWDKVLEKADAEGCRYIATGHYARIKHENGRWFVSKAEDDTKDQTYVLWKLSQEQLSRTLFPLGEMRKADIKSFAEARGFVRLAKKKESQEVCFIPDNDYRGFLKKRVPNLEQNVSGGLFVNKDGKVLGKHNGYPFYTIGQRKGLQIALGKPAYVIDIDKLTNTVTLGDKEDLLVSSMKVTNWIGQKYETVPLEKEMMVKIRYNTPATRCIVKAVENNILHVQFSEPMTAVTPGQSAVFYEDNDVVGGGLILK